MDRKTAFDILNLDASSTLAEAKTAYRNLAKQNHPDVAAIKQVPDQTTEAKMKDINLAFRYLAPLLKLNDSINAATVKKQDPQTVSPKPLNNENHKQTSFLSICVEFFTEFCHRKPKQKFFEDETGKEKSIKQKPDKKVDFDYILKHVQNNDQSGKEKNRALKRKKRSPKTSSFMAYRNYMELKQRIKSGSPKENHDMSVGRVTKVEPVKPVSAIGKN